MYNALSEEVIAIKILEIRGKKVMIDRDLALLYGVETKQLTRQVKRNIERFPQDFMFKLNKEEILKCQFGTSRWGGTRKPPYAFTEHGILMLSSVLNSQRAIKVNIQIMRTFIKLRKIFYSHKELFKKIEAMEKKYDSQFKIIFEAIKKLLEPPSAKDRIITGFRPPDKVK